MSNIKPEEESLGDVAPGDEQGADAIGRGIRGYLIGFACLLFTLGWHPDLPH